jgi:hypothetical protein
MNIAGGVMVTVQRAEDTLCLDGEPDSGRVMLQPTVEDHKGT